MIESATSSPSRPPLPAAKLRTAANQLETVFLAHMLAAAGAGRATSAGGIGEEQFSSLLLNEQAQQIADRGGIGLAEVIIRHYAPDKTGGST